MFSQDQCPVSNGPLQGVMQMVLVELPERSNRKGVQAKRLAGSFD
jgi:hypothetical protein